ncbi:MAG: tRNA (adenosine(37)-N6)-threonylcarbamoyltransferase complex ATPase subunit type 1 TsaE [Candidatus Moranbacteria bacterium]|jgi:tRNA threonylcarbamoyladenosine biosynthesis protein TsaE|nr:tRNA (adenosine(37)-N6)-threonylcarbamoyltransferase complex ATPase subunit type 1 TsaE [Candidatus Moranbacteria bacterium]MDD5652496.1 tRNA (adenosine(37)-N6)-threonylcarbamoyltransferase complex ATPase subunit type 1 TsaE [Candidatus Moranbacteria bacterium]MDX9855549.1 tRNA (adenosine(37)-N6)-threonylcarbamoyltransferase complex ATPase subunit type 1 TsaE [Candidatus Moranbacteria bacterium]
MREIITRSSKETRELGEKLAKKIESGKLDRFFRLAAIICLEGDLGSGKTTFSQGILKGLGARKPYTSPTFIIMKHYKRENKNSDNNHIQNYKVENIYHLDAYRIGSSKDIMDLGWEEIIKDKNAVIILEWPEKVKDIIPSESLEIKFQWVDESRRKITTLKSII